MNVVVDLIVKCKKRCGRFDYRLKKKCGEFCKILSPEFFACFMKHFYVAKICCLVALLRYMSAKSVTNWR